MLVFKLYKTAVETMHMIKKRPLQPQMKSVQNRVEFILFGIVS